MTADGATVVRLADDQLQALADLVAERLVREGRSSTPTPLQRRLVDAQAVADAIGMTAAWVREHGRALGGQRVGDGPRPRWRFDLDTALAAWGARSSRERPQAPQPMRSKGARNGASRRSGTATPLLPIRGDSEARYAA